MLCAVN